MFRKILEELCVLAALVVFLLFAATLQAQDTAASLTGTVTDPSGAVVPGASVELVNPATGQSYKALTNSGGSYSIANITPGPGYNETVSRDGFETTVLTGLYLNVATTRTQNVKLAVGNVAQTVSVSAASEGVTLDTTDATVGNNFEVQYMNELPVSARDSPTALLTQQPGMTQDGSATGARTDQNRLTLDGLDVSDMATGTILNTASNGAGIVHTIIGNAPVDSVQEFRGTTAGMLSSSGNGGGGQFEMVTRSGSNHFHGNINEYHRDTDLEANEWFNNFDGVGRSPLIRNQFGGNVGGPIWKNKVFFFFDYNGRRDTIAQQAERTVPTDSFLKSNTITYYTNIAGGATNSINATQVAGFDPQGVGFDSAMLGVIGGRYPSPNDFTGDKGDLLNTAGYRFNAPTPYTENNYVGKVDVSPFQNHHFFGRVTYNKTNAYDQPNQFPGDPETSPYLDTSHAWVVGWDWTMGTNKSNSLIWGYAVGIDFTRRDRQFDARDMRLPWEVGKSFDASAPCGPIAQISDPAHFKDCAITLSVNGAERQRGNIGQMIWNVPEVIAQLSKQVTLAAGDLIYTGTPSGVGPVVPGDVITAHIDRLPSLTITITPSET